MLTNSWKLIICLFAFTLTTSCEMTDNGVYEVYLWDTTWVDTYIIDNNGTECQQILRFNSNYTGTEKLVYTYIDGFTEQEEYGFAWVWVTDEILLLEYHTGEHIYFQIRRLSHNKLSGKFGEEEVEFTPY